MDRLISLQNDMLSIKVNPLGAELKSLFHLGQQQEYLSPGDPQWWGRSSPVLFPVVGKVRNDTIRTKGGTYPMGQHGFVRERVFFLLEESSHHLVFSFRADDTSKAIYPYDFELQLSYTLDQAQLAIGYKVINHDLEIMPFSIGAHPAFLCPLTPEESFEDYYLEFEEPETASRHLIVEGLFDGSTEPVLEREKHLSLSMDYFKKDAIVFKNLRSQYMTLKNDQSGYSLRFSFSGFPYFGIWTIPGAPFICLEPWCGLADTADFQGSLKEKEGIELLSPGQTFTRTFSIRIG